MARIPNFKCPFCGNPTPKKNIVKISNFKNVCKDCVDYVTGDGQYISEYFFEEDNKTETLCITDSGKYFLTIEEGENIKNIKIDKESAIAWCIELYQEHALERYFPEYER